MRRIMAHLMMLLPVALLAAHAGNNPSIRGNLHLGPEAALSRVAHHLQAHNASQRDVTGISADLPWWAASLCSMNGTPHQGAPVNAAGLSSTASIPLLQAPLTRASLVAEEEDEEEEGDEEEDGGDNGEGEGEEEEGEGGWDRVWDAPKLG